MPYRRVHRGRAARAGAAAPCKARCRRAWRRGHTHHRWWMSSGMPHLQSPSPWVHFAACSSGTASPARTPMRAASRSAVRPTRRICPRTHCHCAHELGPARGDLQHVLPPLGLPEPADSETLVCLQRVAELGGPSHPGFQAAGDASSLQCLPQCCDWIGLVRRQPKTTELVGDEVAVLDQQADGPGSRQEHSQHWVGSGRHHPKPEQQPVVSGRAALPDCVPGPPPHGLHDLVGLLAAAGREDPCRHGRRCGKGALHCHAAAEPGNFCQPVAGGAPPGRGRCGLRGTAALHDS